MFGVITQARILHGVALRRTARRDFKRVRGARVSISEDTVVMKAEGKEERKEQTNERKEPGEGKGNGKVQSTRKNETNKRKKRN